MRFPEAPDSSALLINGDNNIIAADGLSDGPDEFCKLFRSFDIAAEQADTQRIGAGKEFFFCGG